MAKELARVKNLSLVEAVQEDTFEIRDRLRFYDVRECYIHGASPTQALTDPFYVLGSRTYSIKLDDKVIGMCGTVPVDEKMGRVWMLGTQEINDNWRTFLRGTKKVVEILQGEYDTIENFVPIDHIDTIMWLQWSGFEIEEQGYEVSSHTMVRFTRCKKNKNNVYYLRPRPVMH